MEVELGYDLKPVLTPEDMADLLAVSIHTIYAATSKRKRASVQIELPPWFHVGRFVRWYRQDVIKWLNTREKNSN